MNAKTNLNKSTADQPMETRSSLSLIQDELNERLRQVRYLSHSTFLIGLAVLDRSVEEANNALNKLDEQMTQISEKGSDLVEELIERGQRVQDDAQDTLTERREQFELSVNAQVAQLKQTVTELGERTGIAGPVDSVAEAFDSFAERFKKSA